MGLVHINGRFIHNRISGVERYAFEVMQNLPPEVRVHSPPRNFGRLLSNLWEQLYLPRLLPAQSILLSLANTGPLALDNQVITIHDVSPLDHPEWFHPNFALWYRYLIPRLAQRSLLVITDSEFSRGRIVSRCKIPPEKIRTIPCGVNLNHFSPEPAHADTFARVRKMYGLEGEYILSVGTIEPRKNLAILAQAWDMVRSRLGSMLLVIVGGIKSHFQKSHIPDPATDILVLNSVPDEHLPALYAGASAFIYPSLYEGFGLPILEAMACGTPVISSNRTALPEAVGSAGLLVDPEDSSHLAETILSTIQNPELKAHLRGLGLERVREFTWEQTAGRIWDAVLSLGSHDPA